MNTSLNWEIPTEMLAGETKETWDCCPEPFHDESFLSWFTRLAKVNCSDVRLLYQQLRNTSTIRNMKLELLEKELELIQTNKKKLNTLVEALLPFLTISFEKLDLISIPLTKSINQWDYLNNSTKFPRFCPHCLESDEIPYFRRSWFLNSSTICKIHHSLLLDSCPHCNAVIKIWNTDWDKNIINCYKCNREISQDVPVIFSINNMEFHKNFEIVLQKGVFNGEEIDKTHFFRQLWRLISHENSIINNLQEKNVKIPIELLFRAIMQGMKIFINNPEKISNACENKETITNTGRITIQDVLNNKENLPKELNLDKIKERIHIISPLLDKPVLTLDMIKEWAKTTEYSWRSIYRWMLSYREQGIKGIIPNYGSVGRKPKRFSPDFEIELKKIIDEYIFEKPDLTIKKVFEICLEKANKAELPKGSITYSLIRRRIISEREKFQNDNISNKTRINCL